MVDAIWMWREMKGRVEDVKRTSPILLVRELSLFLRRFFVHNDECSG